MAARTPRWLGVFNETLSSEDKNPTYTLSSVLSTSSEAVPRSRSVIHRAIIVPSPSRPLLLTTTDIRTPKAYQLHVNNNSEATFWFSKPNIQFRIVAATYLLPQPSHPWHASFPGRDLSGSENTQLDWDLERLNTFDGISAHLRASFVRPIPGTPMDSYDEAKKWPETAPKRGEAHGEEQQQVLEQALANFALVVLDPTEVEYLELGPIPNRRTRWTKKGDEWQEQIVVP